MRPLLVLLALLSCSVGCCEQNIPVQTLILEAGGEGYAGMKAVGEVIRNRAFKAHRTFEEVCLAPRQFSCWNRPQEAQERLKRVSSKTFKTAEDAWEASRNTLETQGATHYHTLPVHPYWSKGKRPTVIIGHHVFYNNVR